MTDDIEADEPTTLDEAAEAAEVSRRTRGRLLAALLVMLLLIIVGLAFFPLISDLIARRGGSPLVAHRTYAYFGSIPATGGAIHPTGIAISPDGRVYVADPDSHQVRVFDPTGRQLFAFGALKAEGQTHLAVPVHVAIAGGEVYVTDRRLRGLYVFGLDGRFSRRFVRPDPSWSPLGVSVADDGQTYVTDVGVPSLHRIRVFSPSGMDVFDFGRTAEVKQPDQSPGAFYYPDRAVAFGDRLFVADSNNGRVQVFDRSGVFRYMIPTGGVPRGLAFDAKGQLLVADALGGNVLVYTQGGKKVDAVGADGDFQFPNDVAIDGTGRIYVADRGRVTVWGRPGARPIGLAALTSRVRWEWLLLAIPIVAVPPLRLLRRHLLTGDEEVATDESTQPAQEGYWNEDDDPRAASRRRGDEDDEDARDQET